MSPLTLLLCPIRAQFRCFEVFLPIVRGRLALIEELAFRFVERQAAQGVIYTEVRYSPQLLADGGLLQQQKVPGETGGKAASPEDPPFPDSGKSPLFSEHASKGRGRANSVSGAAPLADAEAVYASVTRGLRRGEALFGVTVNQIFCMLAFRPDWAAETVAMAAAHRHDVPCAVVGVDIAGGEEWFQPPEPPPQPPRVGSPLSPQGWTAVDDGPKDDAPEVGSGSDLHTAHAEALASARALGLNITLHAGEDTNAGNVMTAIFEHGASRIGHGYHLAEDPVLLARAIAHGVHFECCPTSSFETGGWAGADSDALSWDRHPTVRLLRSGASVGINSDDPAVFATSLTEELALCAQPAAVGAAGGGGMGLSMADLRAMTLAAADAAFLPPDQRAALRARVEARFAAAGK